MKPTSPQRAEHIAWSSIQPTTRKKPAQFCQRLFHRFSALLRQPQPGWTTALFKTTCSSTTLQSRLDERHFLDNLGQGITELENRPAHLTQSVEQSSLDAWFEKYPYYGLPERSISYYNKGELLGVLLDLAMRDASHDQSSLGDLFRSMNERYAKQGKFFADSGAVEQSAEMLSHADLPPFFEQSYSCPDQIPC